MSGFKHFLLFAGICLLVTAVLAALIYWQRDNISNWWFDTTNGVVRLVWLGPYLDGTDRSNPGSSDSFQSQFTLAILE